jgi:hypothetical protein
MRDAGQERTEDATDEQRAIEESGGPPETAEPSAPDPDIQAIMTILRRRTRFYMHGEAEGLDLAETNLSRANLYGANLEGALLSEADLREADLSQEQLEQAVVNENTQLPRYLKHPDEQPEED